ncbi:TonB-dependent receptor [uncultured Sphingomonas sp.]|uniref:TonB-dependent receptor plug domain-containing protein n=1 Tax=uncultured Sphingomonas sp. TaxID=158754 RepID=UPI002635329F|nr:TonB-dependent receptor [uncultured Sphingomonas sp.]
MNSVFRFGYSGLVVISMLAMPALAHAADAPPASGAPAPGDDTETADLIIVTGTRSQAQTQFTALSPIDVFSAKTLQSTVSSSLDGSLAQLIPSFSVKRLPSSDGLQFVRPASLNGLSPDMTLVMINGKRFHRSAFLGSGGAQAADLAQIPSYAISHVEVLRDGASAQYGSDAIAGVVNVMLDEKPGFSAYAQGSQYYAGDGTQWQAGARAGFRLQGGGHLVIAGEYSNASATSRTRQRPDAIAFQAANPQIKVPDPVQNWGNPEVKALKLVVDAATPIAPGIELYTFGTFARTRGMNDINWRNPSTNANIFGTTAIFPGWDLNKLFPAGFTPHEGIRAKDGQAVGGVRRTGSGNFTWDLSASYGVNNTQFVLNNSINASLGPKSPFNFNLGHQIQREFNLNADAVYQLDMAGLPRPVSIAFGAERRVETYQVIAGDPASYAVGPGAAAGLAAQSNGFPGFGPSQAGSWSQTDYAGYLDVQVPLTEAWTIEGALRDENYDTFGNTFNYKIATRYEFAPGIAVRGAFSTGFKAPSPGQLNATSISQGLDTKTLQLFTTGRLSPLNPVAAFFGAKALEPEESKTATAGFVWRTGSGLSGSLDIYQIKVTKRFSLSPTFVVTPAIRAQLVALGVAGAGDFTNVNFFTNDFDTRTRGLDFVLSYNHPVGPGRLNATAAYSFTDTKVISGSLTSANSVTQRTIFENGLPRHNATGTITYDIGKLTLLARSRYYGAWTDSSGNATGDIFQRFGGLAFFDASVSYAVNQRVAVRIGAENIFNTYPDKALFQASRGLVYSRNSPYDTNGGNYYARLEFKY